MCAGGWALTGNSLPGLSLDPWDQVPAGIHLTPSIWADLGPMVTKGSPVTIWCPGSLRADVYRLYRERPSGLWEAEAPRDSSNKASFPFESLSSSPARQYQCASRSRKDRGAQSPPPSAQPRPVVASRGSVSLARSSQSAAGTLHLLKEGGMYRKPSLSAQLGASGPCTENVTLQCGSEDTAPRFQNSFTLSPVTSAHSGTYTCYSSLSTSPSLMSQPSDPLELLISGGSEDQLLPHTESGVQTGLKWYLNVLIGVSVAFVLLLLVLLFLLVRHRGQGRRGKSEKGSGVAWRPIPNFLQRLQHQCSRTEAGRRGKTSPKDAHPARPARSSRTAPHTPLSSPSSSPAVDFQEESLYAVVEDTQPEDGRQLDSQAAASEAPQDVTYAQLNHSTLRRETAPPAPQSGEPPAEPSVYAALAVR
ncbi:leukocyte immunoglobulin-like receptor subfamily B member 3 [Balaenoptera acutorostrata]|uniref:Leukocyte immunoglobulin-like receptor subfamily B member 3 n=1 Tax=Balaenoptera acutorostrata TaxID=9767 RepID=A0ABM3SIP7_BALAC|nr:leukocyte immunoglobulin-like receptor subfamily B member 3 [Balaenoptera acutorostrata]